MSRLRFDETTLYIIRSKLQDDDDSDIYIYYEAANAWTTMPHMATIFRSYDTAEDHLVAAYQVNGDDGSITDIVPLRGELVRLRQEQGEE